MGEHDGLTAGTILNLELRNGWNAFLDPQWEDRALVRRILDQRASCNPIGYTMPVNGGQRHKHYRLGNVVFFAPLRLPVPSHQTPALAN
jgi:hypothetical protein